MVTDPPDPDREGRVLQRAAEILARPEPSAADLAERAARQHARRIAEIMSPPPAVVHKRLDNALLSPAAPASGQVVTWGVVAALAFELGATTGRLEARVAALEAAGKPRFRIRAGSAAL